jgi:hypothetical protein
MRRASAPINQPLSTGARYRQQQADRARKERIRAAGVAWTATGVALAITSGSALAFREDVARVWPKAASAYAAVGLDVNIYGLTFNDLAVEFAYSEADPVLLVRGAVANIGRGDKQAPLVRFSLRDQKGEEIQSVFAQLPDATIAPGGAMPFEVRIENPDLGAADLEATFATSSQAAHARLQTIDATAPQVASFDPAADEFGATEVLGPQTSEAPLELGPAAPLGDVIEGLAPRQSWGADEGNG